MKLLCGCFWFADIKSRIISRDSLVNCFSIYPFGRDFGVSHKRNGSEQPKRTLKLCAVICKVYSRLIMVGKNKATKEVWDSGSEMACEWSNALWVNHRVTIRDENGSDTDGYHRYYICFHISVWIRIQIPIVSTISDRIWDRIWLDIDIINMRFEYSDTNSVLNVEYPDPNIDIFKSL